MTSQKTNQHMIWSKLPFNRFLWFLMIIILINDYKMKKQYRTESFSMFYTQYTFKLHMKTISNLTVHWVFTVRFHQLWQFVAMKDVFEIFMKCFNKVAVFLVISSPKIHPPKSLVQSADVPSAASTLLIRCWPARVAGGLNKITNNGCNSGPLYFSDTCFIYFVKIIKLKKLLN